MSTALLCGCGQKAEDTTQPTLEELRQEARRIDRLALDAMIVQEALEDSLTEVIPLSHYDEGANDRALYLQYQIDSLEELIRGYAGQLNALEDSTRRLYDTYCL